MAKHNGKASPARRARSRRDPAIFRPPPGVRGKSRDPVSSLRLQVGGRTYPIGLNIEGDTPWSMGMDQTGTITLTIRDPGDGLRKAFTDEGVLQHGGARVKVNGTVYVVQTVDDDGQSLYTLTLEDEVSWRLKRFSRFRAASRARTTRYGFIYSFVREASRKPYPRMRAFIPEVDDKRPINRPNRGASS